MSTLFLCINMQGVRLPLASRHRLQAVTMSSTAGPAISRSAVRISRKIFDMLNAQGNREWEASLFYAGCAHWFNKNELHGSERW